MRVAVGESVDDIHDYSLKDIYNYVQRTHDLALLGKSVSRAYCEIKIVLHFLKYCQEDALPFPEDWF